MIESTYGDKDHEDRETRRYRLKAVLEHALEDGGTGVGAGVQYWADTGIAV